MGLQLDFQPDIKICTTYLKRFSVQLDGATEMSEGDLPSLWPLSNCFEMDMDLQLTLQPNIKLCTYTLCFSVQP